MVRAALLAVVLLAACPAKKDTSHPELTTAPDAGVMTEVKEPPQTPKSMVGTACTPGDMKKRDIQGSCPEGLMCYPFAPGGYCLSLCTGSCSSDAVCVDAVRTGDLCLQPCASDEGCRVDEGYTCDPQWHACVHTDSMGPSPKPPVCGRARPEKKTFGKAEQISSGRAGGSSHFEPSAGLAGDGTLRVVFITRTSPMEPNDLGYTEVRPDGTPDADCPLQTERNSHFDPWVATDKSGAVHAVWLGHSGFDFNMQIGYAQVEHCQLVNPHGIHYPADYDDTKQGGLDKPMIAIGPDVPPAKKTKPKGKKAKKAKVGEAMYVAYTSHAGNGLRVMKSVDGGKKFAPPVTVGEYVYADLLVDANGGVHVVYGTVPPRAAGAFGDPDGAIEYVSSLDGGKTFSKATRVSAPGQTIPGLFVNPQVAVDAKKKLIYVVYATGTPDARWDIMLATSKDGGASWTQVKVNDDESCANHMLPEVLLDPKTGKVHVFWIENRSGKGDAAYTVCDSGGAACGANERVSDEPFVAYALSRHSNKWLGEYNSFLLDEKRRVLHAVWGQMVEEDGGPTVRIFHASAKLP